MSYSGGEGRPPIPAEIRRGVLVEAGHRCAIPTCRYIEVEVHHIVPWAKCQSHQYDNLIALCPNCHKRADRGEIDRKSLKLYKANLRFAHDKFSQLEIDVLFEVSGLSDGQFVQWPAFNMLLLKRLLDAGYLAVQEPQGGVFIGGMQSSPCRLRISEKGRAFIKDIGIHEL
ncbi:HNH endonuclease [Roseibium sp.]|uniref:HNH endonuclease n=1 Tax=Roseibium sp. TaxID=1936156 RepID=UPI003A97758C